MPHANTCHWHAYGVPVRFQGERFRWKWFAPGCCVCASKWAKAEKIPGPDVVTPEQLANDHPLRGHERRQAPTRTQGRAA